FRLVSPMHQGGDGAVEKLIAQPRRHILELLAGIWNRAFIGCCACDERLEFLGLTFVKKGSQTGPSLLSMCDQPLGGNLLYQRMLHPCWIKVSNGPFSQLVVDQQQLN